MSGIEPSKRGRSLRSTYRQRTFRSIYFFFCLPSSAIIFFKKKKQSKSRSYPELQNLFIAIIQQFGLQSYNGAYTIGEYGGGRRELQNIKQEKKKKIQKDRIGLLPKQTPNLILPPQQIIQTPNHIPRTKLHPLPIRLPNPRQHLRLKPIRMPPPQMLLNPLLHRPRTLPLRHIRAPKIRPDRTHSTDVVRPRRRAQNGPWKICPGELRDAREARPEALVVLEQTRDFVPREGPACGFELAFGFETLLFAAEAGLLVVCEFCVAAGPFGFGDGGGCCAGLCLAGWARCGWRDACGGVWGCAEWVVCA